MELLGDLNAPLTGNQLIGLYVVYCFVNLIRVCIEIAYKMYKNIKKDFDKVKDNI